MIALLAGYCLPLVGSGELWHFVGRLIRPEPVVQLQPAQGVFLFSLSREGKLQNFCAKLDIILIFARYFISNAKALTLNLGGLL